MKVLLVLILIVGAFCLGAWTDHVFYIPLGSSSNASASADTAPAPQQQQAQQAQQAQQQQQAAPAGSNTPDLRSCLAEARSRHLEPDYAQRMCREIVND